MVTDRPRSPLGAAVAFVGWLLPHLVSSEDLQWELLQAGYRRPDARNFYAGSKVILCLAFLALIISATQYFQMPVGNAAMISITAGILGYCLPNIWVAYRQSQRREEITLTLPDALDLMVICVEAGQGLNAALLSVGKEMHLQAPALSEELQVVNYEIRMGLSRGQALRNFAARTGVEEARSLSAVLIQSDRLGTSIARALRIHADSMRTRRRQRAEEAARKTPVKLVFPLVFFIFPELLVVLLAPAMIQLIRVLASAGGG